MASLVSTVQELSLSRDLESIMRIVRTVARKLTGADGATFVLRDNGMCYYADEDAISPLWKGNRFPMETCISGWTMLNKKAAIIEDIYQDDRIPHAAYRPTFVKSLVMVPIRTIDPIGAIGNYWAYQHEPSEDEITLLQALADITAVAIENVYVYKELEDRVKERTQQLEVVNKQLESFSYSVSHDLRSPLSSMTGLLEWLNESAADKLDEESKEITHLLGKCVNQMDNLIKDFLVFFMNDKKELEKFKIDMKALVEEIAKNQKSKYPNKNIFITMTDLPSVSVDQSLIRQVWENLISNAVKYSFDRENVTVAIGFQRLDKQIIYSVKDNGVGFDMAHYEKLFNAFQRLHNQSDFEGSGIGLSIVEKIINRHGGKIWADSIKNEGSVFYFSLPE